MRRYIRSTAAATLLLLGSTNCDRSILEVQPKDQMSDKMVFANLGLAQAFLNDIYGGMGHGLYEIMLSSLSDESHFIHGYGTDKVVRAVINPSDRGAINDGRFRHYDWSGNYSRIRQANTFLAQIDASAFSDADKQRMKGEATFLRAYFYHNLLRMYGGVPLITRVYGLNESYDVSRNSFKETVAFIVKDADVAVQLLPTSNTGSNEGRATKGAALALKARVLLYAASDLYNLNPSKQPETGYVGAEDRTALWRAAKTAAKAVMDLGPYRLFRPTPTTPAEAAKNYGDLFLQKTSEEVIMSRFFVATRNDGYHPGLHNGPNGYHNWAGNTPTQNLVDDYRMADGTAFDWTDPVKASAPYENREPRFYASILHDGAQWRERPSDAQRLDPQGIIQSFRQLTLPDGSNVGGLDTRAGPIEDWNGSYSGYYLRKFIDPTVNHQFIRQEVPWIFFRYAETLLNYAEASIELGEVADATTILNQIRRRAGLPALSSALSQAQLRDEYRKERRVEMVFEEQRFFDVRRWMTAPAVFGKDAFGINISLKGTNRVDRSTWTNYQYQVRSIQGRAWNDKMYFMPIQVDEMNRNAALKQNPQY